MKRCTCKYRADGKLLGLCLRCFQMGIKELNSGRRQAFQECLEIVGEDRVIDEYSARDDYQVNEIRDKLQEKLEELK